MGKSRLVLEFRRALVQASEAVTWLEGHCISFGQASPFLPLIELLRENFHIDELDGEPEIIAKVEQGMRRMGNWRRTSPPSATCFRSTRAMQHSPPWMVRRADGSSSLPYGRYLSVEHSGALWYW